MRPRFILFIVGILVTILGAAPLIANFIPAAAAWLEGLPKAGSITYQAALTVIGILAVVHSIKGPGDKQGKRKLLKALGK